MALVRSLQDGVGLAPMEGVSDFPMRLWMSVTSKPYFQVTPFLRVTQTFPKHLPHNWAPEILEKDLSKSLSYKLVPQLMCPDPEPFVHVAKKVLQHTSFVELNCGCPAPVVVGKGAGSGLIRDPNVLRNFLNICTQELAAEKLAVKIRTGFETSERYPELIDSLQGFSLRRLTIHGRTRAQKYRGYANWGQIALAARQLQIPVHGSGDITDELRLQHKLEGKALAGVIVGRGALRNPWIFQELRTGKNILIEGKTLVAAIECYALVLELFSIDSEALYEICLSGAFKQELGVNYQGWLNLNSQLKEKVANLQDTLVSKRSLGKVKMLWNYLRSSLPAPMFNPKLLRSRSYEDFLAGLKNSLEEFSSPIKLQWQQDYDWIYAGEKKPDS